MSHARARCSAAAPVRSPGSLLRAVSCLVAAAAVGLTAGCATSELSSTAPPSTAPPSTADAPRTNDDHLEQLAADLGIDDPPEVAVVRAITPDESKQVWDDCMVDAGWTASRNTEGELGFSVPAVQEDAWNLATYRCTAAYPIQEEFLQPPSEADLRALFAYYQETYAPCLREQGLDPAEAPTLETFLADGGTWQPLDFDRTLDAIVAGQVQSFEQLEAVCPSRPT